MPRLADGESALTRTPRGSCGSSLSIDTLKINDSRGFHTLHGLHLLSCYISAFCTAV